MSATGITTFEQSEACCTVPRVNCHPYEIEGEYFECNDTKIYATGSLSKATKGIMILYDIFGYSSQILKGADLLATSEPDKQYAVFMPDFFDGSPAPMEIWPDDTPEKKAALEAFLSGPGETNKTIQKLLSIRSELMAKYTQITDWAIVGYCWGGWVSSFAIGPGTPFKVCAQLHPGFVGTAEASKIQIPVLALCSKDEPQDEWQPFEEGLRVPYRIEHFPDMIHGWMSARGDLADEKVKADFLKGYQMVLEWLRQHL